MLPGTTGARAHNYNDAIKYKFFLRVVQKVTPLVVATYSNIEGKFQQKFQLLCLSKVTDGQIILSLLTDTSVVKSLFYVNHQKVKPCTHSILTFIVDAHIS